MFQFDLNSFRLSAIKKAAYRFSGKYRIEFQSAPINQVVVTMTRLDGVSAADCFGMVFENEVLDQELREIVAEETKVVRDILLAQAFSGISLIDPEGETADYNSDPLNITSSRNSTQTRFTPKG